MGDRKNDNKIMFIPGWLDSGELHGYKNSLDIWNNNIDIDKSFDVDVVIAHSLGALVALQNWNTHRNFKIILINPIFQKENIFIRWLKFIITEGTPCPPKRIIIFLSLFSALAKAKVLFKIPVINILNMIPQNNLTIIYGEKDKYLYDRELIDSLNRHELEIINIKGSGHNYDFEIEKAIVDLINKTI